MSGYMWMHDALNTCFCCAPHGSRCAPQEGLSWVILRSMTGWWGLQYSSAASADGNNARFTGNADCWAAPSPRLLGLYIYILHAPVVNGLNKLQERYSGRGNLGVTEFGALPPWWTIWIWLGRIIWWASLPNWFQGGGSESGTERLHQLGHFPAWRKWRYSDIGHGSVAKYCAILL